MNFGPVQVKLGDSRESLRAMPADSVDVIVTSPPFFALRSYLKADDPLKPMEIGSEDTPEAFLAALMEVFDECRRVLKPTGVCLVEFGDSYGGYYGGQYASGLSANNDDARPHAPTGDGLRGDAGQLGNIPHRFAEAMRSHGWRWRSTMIWEKQSAMPESLGGWRWERCKVKAQQRDENTKIGSNRDESRPSPPHPDNGIKTIAAQWQDCPGCPKCSATNGLILRKGQWRPTTAHSYVFMFVKSERYFCDATAAAEPASSATIERNKYTRVLDDPDEQYSVAHDHEFTGATRNPRTIIRVPNEPMDYDLCLKCGRVWRGAEKKRELRKVGKVYACTCGGTEWASHYAAFPRSLVRKLITPAISKGGCCPTCGIPYSPVVEKEHSPRRETASARAKSGHERPQGSLATQRWDEPDITSVSGYLPSCSCPPAPSVPQSVLDPFMGTGTVAVVAAEMGLKAIGCELNKNYIGLIERRVLEVLVPKGQADAAPSPNIPLFGETE